MTALRRVKPELPDGELIEQLARGNLESLGLLFERHGGEVRRFLGRIGVSHSDIDDLLQLTFVQVITAAPGFDATQRARPWLLGIAAMVVRRHRRAVSRVVSRMADWAFALEPRRPDTPAESFEGSDAERRLWQALGQMSAKKREVFVMVTLEGTSGEEASLALGIPLATVWTRLHHARKELSAELFGRES